MTIAQKWTRLEMDFQASQARKSLILGQDFWDECQEEDLRQQSMMSICRYAQAHGEQIHTQREINQFIAVYNTRMGKAA